MTYNTQLTIRAGDTDVIEIPVSPASALEGTRVRARLWLGTITEPTWVHTWDTIDPHGIEVVDGVIRLSTGGASWLTIPQGRALSMTLEVELSRGASIHTLPHYQVAVLPQAILTVVPPVDPGGDPVDGTLTEVWVDGDAGTDLATGSEDDPLRTIGRALELLADGDATIWLRPRAGGAAYDSRPLATLRTRRGRLHVRATPDSWEEWAAPFELGATSTRVMIVASSNPGWGENTARGAILEIVESSTADLVGQRRTILRNTSDTAWVGMGFSANLPAGTKARIIRPTVVLEDKGDGKNIVYLGENARAGLALEGIVFSNNDDQWEFVGSGSLFGCEVRSPAVFYCGRSLVGITAAPEPLPGVPAQALAGCGIAVHGILATMQYDFFAVATCVGASLADSFALLYGFSSLEAANGLTVQASHLVLGSASFFGGPKAPVFISGTTRWLDLRGGSVVLFRSRIEQIGTSTEMRIGERSHANVQNPDLIVTAGTIRAQEDSSYRIDGVPARNSPPGGGFIVGESSFQLTAPDLDDSSLPNKGRIVNPIDGSRIYWAIPEPA
jgi:hypothetical protein